MKLTDKQAQRLIEEFSGHRIRFNWAGFLAIVAIILIAVASCSCMTTTDAKGNTVRQVDPAAREFYGKLAASAIERAIIESASSK